MRLSDTIEAFNWSMPSAEMDALLELHKLGLQVRPTGSRFICPNAAKDDSDWDVFGVVTKEQAKCLSETGWVSDHFNGSGPPEGNSLRKGRLNLIVFWPGYEKQYHAFAAATRHCHAASGPEDKYLRIAVFNVFDSFAYTLAATKEAF